MFQCFDFNDLSNICLWSNGEAYLGVQRQYIFRKWILNYQYFGEKIYILGTSVLGLINEWK